MGGALTGIAAAAEMLRHTDSLARSVTDALYDERPELYTTYGPAGRDRCLQDMRHNIEHLAAAVDLGVSGMFRDYAIWLEGLLSARNVASDDLLRSFELMESSVKRMFTEAESQSILPVLRAGIDAVRGRTAQ
jgi:hypothetical protein